MRFLLLLGTDLIKRQNVCANSGFYKLSNVEVRCEVLILPIIIGETSQVGG